MLSFQLSIHQRTIKKSFEAVKKLRAKNLQNFRAIWWFEINSKCLKTWKVLWSLKYYNGRLNSHSANTHIILLLIIDFFRIILWSQNLYLNWLVKLNININKFAVIWKTFDLLILLSRPKNIFFVFAYNIVEIIFIKKISLGIISRIHLIFFHFFLVAYESSLAHLSVHPHFFKLTMHVLSHCYIFSYLSVGPWIIFIFIKIFHRFICLH